MRFHGRATIHPGEGGLLFHEKGRLSFGAYHGEAEQRLLFRVDGPALSVWFADGRFFHTLDLSPAIVRHSCGPDLYEGRYRLHGPDRWGVTWRITGPRKRQLIASRLLRQS